MWSAWQKKWMLHISGQTSPGKHIPKFIISNMTQNTRKFSLSLYLLHENWKEETNKLLKWFQVIETNQGG